MSRSFGAAVLVSLVMCHLADAHVGVHVEEQAAVESKRKVLREKRPSKLLDEWRGASRKHRSDIESVLLAKGAEARQALRDRVARGRAEEKRMACDLLGLSRDDSSVDTLLGATKDDDPTVRRGAIHALTRVKNPRAIERLREIISGDSDTGAQKSALAALGEISTSADLPRVRALLASDNESVRITAAGVMAMLGDDSAEPIVLQGTSSQDQLSRVTATFHLGHFDTEVARERLNSILADPAGSWKSYARIALANQDLRAVRGKAAQLDRLAILAADGDTTVARWAIERLADDRGPQAIAALERATATGLKSAELAEKQLTALGHSAVARGNNESGAGR